MAIAAAQTRAIYLNFEGRVGIWDGLTPPTGYSDVINFEVMNITVPEQDEVKLISRMTSSYGSALDSQNVPTDSVAAVEIEASTFTPWMLEILLGADVTEATQAATPVVNELVDTALNVWVPIDKRGIDTEETIALKTGADAAVDAAKYQIDSHLGMIKAIHADAVGTGMKISYTPLAITWEKYEAGLAKTAYVHITGAATEKVSNKVGIVDVWRASLKPNGAFTPIGGEYLKGSLTGDLITPSVAILGATPTAPWTWRLRTA